MIHNMIGHHEGVSIFCGIGERCREGEELYRDMKGAGVLPNMVMVFGQMNEPPGKPVPRRPCSANDGRVFPDDEHRDVLLLIDNIFRFIQAGMEVSGLMGQMPSRLGYQPTMGTELSRLEERIANTDAGAITSIQAVYVPADDLTDPAAVHTFSHLSASIVLSRKRASEGLYPAIDLLQSSSKMATPGIVGERHYLWRRKSDGRSRSMKISRTLSPCSAWSNCRRTTARWSPARGGWSDFLRSRFSPPSSLAASRDNSSVSRLAGGLRTHPAG